MGRNHTVEITSEHNWYQLWAKTESRRFGYLDSKGKWHSAPFIVPTRAERRALGVWKARELTRRTVIKRLQGE